MLDNTPTLEAIGRAIDVAALRQSVHAANIANANVEGFRRLDVQFDAAVERMSLAMNAGAQGWKESAAIANQAAIVPTESSVRLDEEMALMAQNALRYQTLLGAFEKTMSLMRLAVREGRE
jgi:flagellar basal-body rod protein FlgB